MIKTALLIMMGLSSIAYVFTSFALPGAELVDKIESGIMTLAVACIYFFEFKS